MALAASTGQAASMAFELVSRGRESAAALEALLQGASAPTAPPYFGLQLNELAAQILRCCDRALDALQGDGGGCQGRKRRLPPCTAAQRKPEFRPRVLASGAEMPTRVEERCMVQDGFLWRKYGQKDIQNSKYPREYFRCTNKYDKGCMATRQVQQSEDDPSLYNVAYFGDHTCGKGAAIATVGDDDEVMKLLVNNFGSSSASSVSRFPWPSSFGDNVKCEALQPLQALCLPEEGGDHREKVCIKVESAIAPPVGLSSSADVSCASPELEALLRYFNWDCFGESSFDIINEFINIDLQ
ncbi:unnamed protein product [Urochloa decumbens]|uniref:WRKY domain-containing protein n=1 Tax=Urochloa decumbens TaxID=240449 RepID=A0ABC8WI51_9POAL